MCALSHTHSHTHAHTHTHTRMHAHTHTRMHAHTHTLHTYTRRSPVVRVALLNAAVP